MRAPLHLGRFDRDKAGVNRVYFQVVDQTIRRELSEVGRFALHKSSESGRPRLMPMDSYSLSLSRRRVSMGLMGDGEQWQ